MTTDDTNGILSTLYHALRAKRRRLVITHLTNTKQRVTVRELAREIAAHEHSLPTTHATGEPYRNAYNALSQTHLPTLADAGIIIYDPTRQTITRGPNYHTAALLLAINQPTVTTLEALEHPSSTDTDPSHNDS